MNRADGLAEVFEHIARRLAISPEEAAERCRKVTSDLLAALDVAGHASIPGLGRFSRTQTVLRFEPEPRLAAVVNHRYADLHPISVDRDSEDSLGLGSASAVPEAPVAHELIENSSDSASTVDLASTADSEKSADTTDTTLDSLSGDNVGLATDAPTDEDTYGGGTSSGPSARTDQVVDMARQEVNVPDVDSRSAGDAVSAAGVEAGRDVDQPQQSEPAWNRPAQFPEPVNPNDEVGDDYLAESDYARAAEETEDFGNALLRPASVADAGDATSSEEIPLDEPPAHRLDGASAEDDAANPGAPVVVRKTSISRTYWLLIPILVIAIGGVLWLLRESERPARLTQPAAVSPAADTVASVEERDPVLEAEGDQRLEGTAEGGQIYTDEPPPADSSPADARAGTQNGEAAEPAAEWQPGAVDRRRGGYTLVVSSQATRSEAVDFARSLAGNIRDESLPVDIFLGTARGRSRYRVGVGQFESIEKALSEMDRLASRLPEGAWVLRIRTNM